MVKRFGLGVFHQAAFDCVDDLDDDEPIWGRGMGGADKLSCLAFDNGFCDFSYGAIGV